MLWMSTQLVGVFIRATTTTTPTRVSRSSSCLYGKEEAGARVDTVTLGRPRQNVCPVATGGLARHWHLKSPLGRGGFLGRGQAAEHML